jgi:hypothetical protein
MARDISQHALQNAGTVLRGGAQDNFIVSFREWGPEPVFLLRKWFDNYSSLAQNIRGGFLA